jgi:hypothetical protein
MFQYLITLEALYVISLGQRDNINQMITISGSLTQINYITVLVGFWDLIILGQFDHIN